MGDDYTGHNYIGHICAITNGIGHIGMVYIVTVYIEMAYILMAYIAMAYIVMACIVMACADMPGLYLRTPSALLRWQDHAELGACVCVVHWSVCADVRANMLLRW